MSSMDDDFDRMHLQSGHKLEEKEGSGRDVRRHYAGCHAKIKRSK